MSWDRLIRKIKRLPHLAKLLKSFLVGDSGALLALIEDEAKYLLEDCVNLGICNIEEIEDLLFHIKSYNEIPKVVKDMNFPDMRDIKFHYENGDIKLVEVGKEKPTVEELEAYIKYIEEVERERAVERDFIFEKVKSLPLGFVL